MKRGKKTETENSVNLRRLGEREENKNREFNEINRQFMIWIRNSKNTKKIQI